MKYRPVWCGALALVLLGRNSSALAQSKSISFDKPTAKGAPLFEDRLVARGKGVEIRQSQVEEQYLAFKGHRAAMGEAVPDELRPRIESDILDKLIATRLFLQRATAQDKASAKEIANGFIAEQKKQTLSEDSFRRQLLAVGMTPAEFTNQIHEQAIVKAVIDREIKSTKNISDAEAKKFYDTNTNLFREPELVHVSHILISTRDSVTGKPLVAEAKLRKKQEADKILARARAGEDFGKLVKEFSQDPITKDRGGDYTFPRAKDNPRQAMVPEFEAAAFSMKPKQISDLVETAYGYHIIRCVEKVPARIVPYTQVETKIKENLLRDEVEKSLPAYLEKLRAEAKVEILTNR